MPYVVTNGEKEGSDKFGYRSWGGFGPEWTSNVFDAVWYVRRKDADCVHAEDEDACFIREITEQGLLVAKRAKTGGPRFTVEEKDGNWCVMDTHTRHKFIEMNLRSVPADDMDEALVMSVCALALNQTLVKIDEMRKEHSALMMALLASSTTEHQDRQDPKLEGVNGASDWAAYVLLIFRAFVSNNAKVWALGANDHHHPMYELMAEALDKRAINSRKLETAEWQFIQATNRQSLTKLFYDQRMEERNKASEQQG